MIGYRDHVNRLRQRQADRAEAAKSGKSWGWCLDGSNALRKGDSPADCPYALGTPEQLAWWAGWQLAFEKRFEYTTMEEGMAGDPVRNEWIDGIRSAYIDPIIQKCQELLEEMGDK